MTLLHELVNMDPDEYNLSAESTILRYRHLLKAHDLSSQTLATVNATLATKRLLLKRHTVVDATLVSEPNSIKDRFGDCDHKMHQTKGRTLWHSVMTAHIGLDLESSLLHTVTGSSTRINDVTQAQALVHEAKEMLFAKSGYHDGVSKSEETQDIHTHWHLSIRPSKYEAQHKNTPMDAINEQLEQTKTRIRATIGHLFRLSNHQFDQVKARYRGLPKNTAQLHMPFAAPNRRMLQRTLLQELRA